jgi:hypothetical protein
MHFPLRIRNCNAALQQLLLLNAAAFAAAENFAVFHTAALLRQLGCSIMLICCLQR